jgi:hypothetical protein
MYSVARFNRRALYLQSSPAYLRPERRRVRQQRSGLSLARQSQWRPAAHRPRRRFTIFERIRALRAFTVRHIPSLGGSTIVCPFAVAPLLTLTVVTICVVVVTIAISTSAACLAGVAIGFIFRLGLLVCLSRGCPCPLDRWSQNKWKVISLAHRHGGGMFLFKPVRTQGRSVSRYPPPGGLGDIHPRGSISAVDSTSRQSAAVYWKKEKRSTYKLQFGFRG